MTLLPKCRSKRSSDDDQVGPALKAIGDAARTGEIGDGRIFGVLVEQSCNIRTGATEF